MLHNKAKALNLVKAVMITWLIFSCLSFVGCGNVVNSLIQKLKDEDFGVRKNAAEALGKIKDARAVEPLIAALKGEPQYVENEIVYALGEIGAPAFEPLIAALRDKDSDVRRGAAEALGKIKDTRAVEPLIAALKDENSWVREYAADALGEIKDARAVEPLIAALRDKDSDVRRGAAWALGEIKDTRAVEPLIAELKDKDAFFRRNVADALGEVGAPAFEPLIAALRDKDSDVRGDAAWALGKIKDARVVEPLIVALKDEDKGVRRLVADVLGETGDKRAFSPLVENLCDWYSNDNAASALSKLGWIPKSDMDKIHFCVGLRDGKKLKENWNTTKDVLLKDVKSNDYCTIENALYAFVAIGKSEIIPVLIETLNTAGNKTMAEAYLNCGHSGLADAAKDWAWRHGYSISTGSGNAPVGWGQW